MLSRALVVVLLIAVAVGIDLKAIKPKEGNVIYNALNPAISYSGRVKVNSSGSVQYDWSNIKIKTTFQGTTLSLILKDYGNMYNVYIDEKLVQLITTKQTGSVTTYPISTVPSGVHKLVVAKRTEAFVGGVVEFMGFEAGSDTKLLPSHQPKDIRRVEFIGDSITCSYGVLGKFPCDFSAATEDVLKGYGQLIADQFGAQIYEECWSGEGLVRNYGDKNITSKVPFTKKYPRTLANVATDDWSFSRYIPDAVVINLGTNDYSTEPHPPQDIFENAFHKFLGLLSTNYKPDTQYFLVCGPLISNPCCEYVQNVVSSSSDNVHYVDMQNILDNSDRGCNYHPNVSGHLKMFNVLSPIMQKVMKWSLVQE